MKFSYFGLLAMASLATCQTLADIPSCALECLNDAVSQTTSCSATDVACICKQFDAIQGAAAGCVISACGQDTALNEVLPATQKLCASSSSDGTTAKSGSKPTQKPGNSAIVVSPPQTTQEPAPASTTTAATPPVVTAGAGLMSPWGALAVLAMGAVAL